MIVNGVVSYRYTLREKFELNNLCLSGFHNIDIATPHIRRHAYVVEIQAIFSAYSLDWRNVINLLVDQNPITYFLPCR